MTQAILERPQARSRPDAQRLRQLRRQYEAAKQLEDTDDEDLIAFLGIYQTLRANGVALPYDEVQRIDEFIRMFRHSIDLELADRETENEE